MITMKLVCDERRCNNVRIRITNNRRKAELATDMYLPPLDLDLALSPNPPKRLERLANVLAYWNKQLDALKMEIYQQGGRFMNVAEIKERVANKLFGRQIENAGRDDSPLYWARHSWATIAYSIGIPKDIISQALGHSFGVAITDVYIDYDNEKVDESNRRVLDWVLYGKR